jgi:hypothetical protein
MESVADLGWTLARELMVLAERVVKTVALRPVQTLRQVWYGRRG